MSSGGAASAGQRLSPRHSLRLLMVVAVAVAVTLAIVLGTFWQHESARLEDNQQAAAHRSAEIARELLQRRVERGRILVRAMADSRAMHEAIASRSSGRLRAVLRRFREDIGPLHVAVLDPSGHILATSSPLALRAFGIDQPLPETAESNPRAGMVAGDLSALIVQPVEASNRSLGTIRTAVQLGRIFIRDTTQDLDLPLVLIHEGHVAHHTFSQDPAPPPTPRDQEVVYQRFSAGEESFDLALVPVSIFSEGDVWLGAGESRAPVIAARQRFLTLVASLGLGGIVLVTIVVGAFLLLGHRRERRLVSQRDAAVHRSEGLSDRLAHLTAVVHDIKAPVGGIQLRCEGLVEDTADTSARTALNQVVDTCERLSLYLVNVLTAAQAEEGTIRPQKNVVLLAGLLEEVIESVTALAERQGVRLRTSASDDLPPVRGDGVLLERALLNLASNAIAATPHGGEVELFARSGDQEVILGARDTGSGFEGIRPEDVFDQSRVVVKDHSLKAGSTGLGLFIVSRIAQAHGGRAEASNRPDGGAEVRLILPL